MGSYFLMLRSLVPVAFGSIELSGELRGPLVVRALVRVIRGLIAVLYRGHIIYKRISLVTESVVRWVDIIRNAYLQFFCPRKFWHDLEVKESRMG
jgi:hypothetical protein